MTSTAKQSLWLLFGAVLVISIKSQVTPTDPDLTEPVQLSQGTTITGDKSPGTYEQFLGVPFAKPPVGPLRFKNPEPLAPWNGDLKAISPHLHCWQVDPQLGFPLSGDEDCLYLNLYRPTNATQKDPKKPLNVIVFLHGGGFYAGTNNPGLYGPDYFMETGEVILVVPTHRVGVFGFLTTQDAASPGNYGLKDQTMALQWVKDNIAAFGGDPNQVTLLGHSAGSASVNYQMLSKQSEGLFKNAVMLSGAVDAQWAMPMKNPRNFTNRHAKVAGIANPEKLTSEELVAELRKIPARELTDAVTPLKEWDILPPTNYVPSVEPQGTQGAIITEDPRVLMERGEYKKVPLYISHLPNDGINMVVPILKPGDKYKEVNADMKNLLPLVLYFQNTSNPKVKEIVEKVRVEYLGPSGQIEGEAGLEKAQKMVTDRFFGEPFFDFLQKHGKASDKPTFATVWAYKGQGSLAPVFTQSTRKYKASHGDDLVQLFRMRMLFPADDTQLSADDKVAQKMLMRQIVDFAKTDNPGFEPWTVDKPQLALVANDEGKTKVSRKMVAADPKDANYKFWKDIQKMYEDGEGMK